MPFAILCYNPEDEFQSRRLIQLTASRIQESTKRRVHYVSMARLFWNIIEGSFGVERLKQNEAEWGFVRTEEKIFKILSSHKHGDFQNKLSAEISKFDPENDIVFIVRTAAFGPGLYRVSTLLEGLYGHTRVPTILFYPGAYEGGSALRFMALSGETNLASPQYRVKIYAT